MGFSSDQPLLSNQLPISVQLADDNEEMVLDDVVETLELLYKRIANAVNTKEGALYVPQEVATFQSYFTAGNPQVFRNVYRKTIDFGALPNAGLKSVPHGITFTSACSSTRIYGSATDPVNLIYIPLPFSSPTLNQNIKLTVDATNVNITTAIDYSAFTRCTIVIEFTKN